MMKTRVLEILDEGTDYFCVVNQFEESDKETCEKIGVSTNYRIVNEFNGTCVCTYASNQFHPKYFENKVVSADSYEGTPKAIGNILNTISDLRYLPEKINVEAVRNYYNTLNGYDSFLEEYNEKKLSVYNAELRKVLFQKDGKYCLKVFDINNNNCCVFEQSFEKKEKIVPIYLWLPEEKLDVCLANQLGIKNIVC